MCVCQCRADMLRNSSEQIVIMSFLIMLICGIFWQEHSFSALSPLLACGFINYVSLLRMKWSCRKHHDDRRWFYGAVLLAGS